MKTTKILVLNTLADVIGFCSMLVKLKKEAPGSLRFMVAVTAEQNTTICQPVSSNGAIEHHAKVTLDRFDKQQQPNRKQIVKPTKRNKRTASVCNTPVRRSKPYSKPKRTARPVMYGIAE